MKQFSRSQQETPLAEMSASVSSPLIQQKLELSSPIDAYETEADSVAEKVVQMPEPFSVFPVTAPGSDSMQRKPLASFIRRKEASSGGAEASGALAHRIHTSRGSGNTMDTGTHTFMQSRFGSDFSQVKIHTGTEAIQMNQELNARAFTVGNDIYFNEGQYNPTSNEGKHLIAHELTHTVQQAGGGNSVQRKIKVDPGLDLDTMGFTTSKSGDEYTCPKITKSSVWNEIFTGMLHSPRVFKLIGTTNSEINSSLKKHMVARMGIIDFASKKKYTFAAGASSKVNPKYWKGPLNLQPGVDQQEALDDLNKNPKEYAIACLAATTMTMVGGAQSNYFQQATSDSDDWIPGDWGYIQNMKFSGKPEDVGLEGENIIYVGLNKYWGHFTGTNTYRLFQEWFDEVKSWNGEAKTKDYRRGPVVGLE